ncbi:retrovirus-related pol polyprotein from transposon TNT 1-94 [Tanacetum coccineum]
MLCKPKSFYDEVNWVAIGYKNPFYLSKAKQVQPALYNGHEIVKTNHACALVHDSEDTLEIPKTTRKQMIEKMKDLECVKKKVKIALHDYSFDELLKIKAKALKEKAKSTKPTTAMTVYPPNTPPKLFPKVLPTKSQVQNKDLNAKVNALQDLNEHFRVENKKVKQHYKELDDSIKLTRAKTIEKTTSLLTEIETLKAQIKGKMKCVTMPDPVKPKKFFALRYTWVKLLRLKDETSEFVIKFLKQIQVGLNKTVRCIHTDNGTEFVNQFLTEYYESVGIFHQKSIPRTAQQNHIVERQNRTLVEDARTMLIFSKALMFLLGQMLEVLKLLLLLFGVWVERLQGDVRRESICFLISLEIRTSEPGHLIESEAEGKKN